MIAIFDIDGTLIDTNYQHALAWYRALRTRNYIVPIWRIHRAIGMGSDRVVTALLDEQVEAEHGEELRDAEGAQYEQLIGEVEPMNGAYELLAELKERGHTIILASSAAEGDVEHYLKLLDANDLVDAYTTSAVMIGDSTWDCKAAKGAAIQSIGVLTGGFSEQELFEAGASVVFDSVGHLRERLHDVSLSEASS